MDRMNLDGSEELYAKMKEIYDEGSDSWTNGDEIFEITRFYEPTQFEWHQRIFKPGMMLHKTGTNVHIYVEEDKLI